MTTAVGLFASGRALSRSHRFTVELGPVRYVFRPARNAADRDRKVRAAVREYLSAAVAYRVGRTGEDLATVRGAFTVTCYPMPGADRGVYRVTVWDGCDPASGRWTGQRVWVWGDAGRSYGMTTERI